MKRQTIADRLAQRMGSQLRPSGIDPALLIQLALLIIEHFDLLTSCFNKPDPSTVRQLSRKPRGRDRWLVAVKAQLRLGRREYLALGGEAVVQAGFATVAAASDEELLSLLDRTA